MRRESTNDMTVANALQEYRETDRRTARESRAAPLFYEYGKRLADGEMLAVGSGYGKLVVFITGQRTV
jgi:hypothetical protein